MKIRAKLFPYLVFILTIILATSVMAKGQIYTGLFSNVAIGGYDTVAYFTEHKAVQGDKQYSTTYKNAEWYFATAANLATFNANPEKYAPQYGGYCAYAVAEKNSLVSSDPQIWKIVNDKLYLNYNADTQKTWEQNMAADIVKGDLNYPKLIK